MRCTQIGWPATGWRSGMRGAGPGRGGRRSRLIQTGVGCRCAPQRACGLVTRSPGAAAPAGSGQEARLGARSGSPAVCVNRDRGWLSRDAPGWMFDMKREVNKITDRTVDESGGRARAPASRWRMYPTSGRVYPHRNMHWVACVTTGTDWRCGSQLSSAGVVNGTACRGAPAWSTPLSQLRLSSGCGASVISI